MRKFLLSILAISLLLIGCGGGSSKSGGYEILNSDDTKAAVAIIDDANADLKKIKIIYRDNMGKTEELKSAMSNKEVQKVKEIAGSLVTQIDEGLTLGESAYQKIEKAREMNINPTYNEYLELKAQAIRKQLEAFEYRKQAAQFLRDSFGGSDPKVIETIKSKFKEVEENFQKRIDEGRQLSDQAIELARQSSQQK